MLSKKKLSRTFASIDASSEDFLATSRLSDSVLRQCVLKLNQFSCITKQSFLITDWSGAGLISYLFCHQHFFCCSSFVSPKVFWRSQTRISLCLLLRHFVLSHISHLSIVLLFFVCLYSNFWAIADRVFLWR